MRRTPWWPLVVVAVLAVAGCTSSGEPGAGSTPVPTSAAAGTPSPSLPAAPAAAPVAGASSVRAAFGTGCGSKHQKIPATRYRATIGDVDGDGRADLEWAVARRGGAIEFGVTSSSGATVAKTVGFASGGRRSVSIGTLSTGQTVALPTDGHAALLFVLHDCGWIEPKPATGAAGTDFLTGYYDPPEQGGGCIGRRLYQVESSRSSSGRETVTGITERISADDRTVIAGERVTLFAGADSDAAAGRYGDGECLPSARLEPEYRAG